MAQTPPPTGLPVEEALPALMRALAAGGRAVLTAPPGAGKTTLVPLALLGGPWATGRILVLEPRRLAARAAAERMAELIGEPVGERVGYRIRGEAKTSAKTRIEVVTEGILTRMIQSDPSLEGVSAVVFDEFHERSLHADLGLALTWEAREALREDLRIVVMSATLDAGPVAALLDDAPVIASEGRAYPVETKWLDTPWRSGAAARGGRALRPRQGLEDAVADLIRRAHGETAGDILAFLPGAPEIARVERALGRLDGATDIRPLFGAMAFRDQRAALAPAGKGRRKIVLATAIAETSLTVEGVRVVVDAGFARRARFDPSSGMSRLVTEAASRAEADQRRGRAGRLAPGVCYRLWTKAEDGARAPFAPPEMETADLAPLALELAAWGAAPEALAFLTPPAAGALAEARALLVDLGALDTGGALTPHGAAVAAAPTHPRLAHMILSAPAAEKGVAATLAALLEARDPLRGAGADIALRLRALARPGRSGADRSAADGALRRIRDDAARLAKRMGAAPGWRSENPGALLARAYPDRIARRRPGGEPRYVLSSGKGARLAAEDELAGRGMLVAADLDGDAREATIRLAAALTRGDVEAIFADRVAWETSCVWSKRERKVEARRRLTLGAIALEDHPWRDAPAEATAAAMTDGVRDLGLAALPWSKAARRLSARVEWARPRGAATVSLAESDLAETLDEWLTPHLSGITGADDLARLDLVSILRAHVGWDGMQAVDRTAPEAVKAPTGAGCPIDYSGARPSISVRLQEMFGLAEHPKVGGAPLLIELLSPAGRPVQTTADLPGFWRSSYADVRKDMRGRYPRHPWPEDPATADPTRRVKPRR
ncbi:MAG: ATP-dependent helicase HrpB [Pseudomonadota bacterium]